MGKQFSRGEWDGIPDPEEKLVRILTEDGGRFRKTAGVVYRCEKEGCLLGFSYPVQLLSASEKPTNFGELDIDGNLLAHAPTITPDQDGFVRPDRPKPFGPWVIVEPLEPGTVVFGHWFFAHRARDPQFIHLSPNGQDLSWAPAGAVMGHPDIQVPDADGDEYNAGSGVVGERDVWTVTDMYKWGVDEGRALALSLENPPGLMSCRHHETTVTLEQVRADMDGYHHRHPVMIPRH
ncbi:hypothetical protein M3G46_00030 [Corynebacterium sanguinis]|uniref:hypothetical protein n=1 Tax=Corynebacterium sanguinis TaxID=2594913 RepID=UPI0021A528B7|nr:hypothetical protein [Corynebacterium sanguinis]MCT2250969.1 hypothetical protein [Corynebacterium sanguinis]